MILLPISTEPSDFVKEQHVCYYTGGGGYDIKLFQVVEAFYRHPQAPDNAIVPVYETRLVKTLKRHDPEAAAIVLLEAGQKSVAYQAVGRG